jgi:hypothetical protein
MRTLRTFSLLVLLVAAGCGGRAPRPTEEKVSVDTVAAPPKPLELQPRLTHFDLSLPYPIDWPVWAADSTEDTTQIERYLPVTLQVDSLGSVTSLSIADPADSLYEDIYHDYLAAIRFEPGLHSGRPTAMALVVQLRVGAVCTAPHVRFPVEPNRGVVLTDLYWESFRANGIEVPRLVSFPSYYYEFHAPDYWQLYPYIIYRVELDSTGDVTAARLVGPDDPFADQLRLGIHWGQYSPLKRDGVAQASVGFLIISLFPNLSYPTPAIDYRADSLSADWDYLRVRFLPDTIGVMVPPVPKLDWSGPAEMHRSAVRPSGFVSARVQVNQAGLGQIAGLVTDSPAIRGVLATRADQRRFYPAIDFSGQPQPYEGLLYLKLGSESNIRVWFSWMALPDLDLRR